MRPRRVRAALLLAAGFALAGCGGGGESGAGAGGAEAAASGAEATPQPEFAPELEIDLSAMRRTPTGLYIRDLDPGTGLAARSGNILFVHYTGWLPTGEEFDSSRGRGEPFSFQLGRGQVIRGWEEGVTGLPIGGKRLLVVPPALAYGARGIPGVIPPNAWLVFEVELLDIKL
ncbi:MAG: FKBP-type peptidyl-prolyl cis-trans isomerase [Gemmatimonadota bacterium]